MSEKVPGISVIIPHYNQHRFLPEALASVCSQRFLPREIIIVDDGSDAVLGEKLFNKFEDCPVRIIALGENKGVSFARNRGVEAACGEFFAFLDADDCWAPGHLDTFVRLWRERYDKVDFYSSRSVWFKRKCPDPVSSQSAFKIRRYDYFDLAVKKPLAVNSSSVILSRNVFEKIGGFREDMCVFEDIDFWMRAGMSFPLWHNEKLTVFVRKDTPGSLSKSLELYDKWTLKKFFDSYLEHPEEKVRRFTHLNLFGVMMQYKKQGLSFPLELKRKLDFGYLNLKRKLMYYLPCRFIAVVKK